MQKAAGLTIQKKSVGMAGRATPPADDSSIAQRWVNAPRVTQPDKRASRRCLSPQGKATTAAPRGGSPGT